MVASAQVLQSESFETGFTLGALTGQNGWSVLPGGVLGSVPTGAVSVSSEVARSGSRAVRIDASLLGMGESVFAFKPISPLVVAGTNRVLLASFWVRFDSSGPLSDFGGISYDSLGNGGEGVFYDGVDDSVAATWTLNPSAITGVPANTWHQVAVAHNMAGMTVSGFWNGQRVTPGPAVFGASDFSDFDFYATGGGDNKGYFDDLVVESFALGTLRGTVQLGDFTAAPQGVPVTVQVINPASNAVLQTLNTTLDAQGRFTVATVQRGTFNIRVKPWRWTSRTLTGIEVTNEGQFFLSTAHFNGDVDNSDEVDLTDLDQIIGAYLESGPYLNLVEDLDGSGEVDLTDIDIAIGNYLQAGG